ncbi:hypothetical protein AB0F18_06335 [Streptomyces sp. NPDC029216]|uniref:hypothetical protein n=1 Tax=Streptomyces sp. NPDC029216 TaxID=3154701 RepID=UPI003400EBA8
MTEPQTEPQAEPQAVADEASESPAPAAGRRKKVLLSAAAVAAALLVGGGVWAASALADADRTAPTAYWVEAGGKLPEAEHPAPVPGNDLTSKLLPAPSGFEPGPDLPGDGNDFYVSGEKAVEGFKEARKGLSGSERKKRDEMLADLKLKGLAGRSYASTGMVVEIRLMQADPKAVGVFADVSKKMLAVIGDDRDAPTVDGYPDAKCTRMSVGDEKKGAVDSFYCVAVQGDVMVNFRAYGPQTAGLSKTEATSLLRNQLSRLKSPGESV